MEQTGVNDTATTVLLEMARLSRLPLDSARAQLLLPTFSAWSEGAVAINALMASEAHRDLIPVTIFSHPSRSNPESK